MAAKRTRLAQRRKTFGFTQESLAENLGVDRTTVIRWERGDSQPQPVLRRQLANALDLSLTELDDLLTEIDIPSVLDNAPTDAVTVRTGTDEGGDTTDRRTFAINAALTGLGIATPLRGLLTGPSVPTNIGMEHLDLITKTVEEIEKGDSALGGDLFCDAAITLHARLARWERESSYSRPVATALQATLGDLEHWIGWLTLDAERRTESRWYLQEAIVRARLNDDPQLEVRALSQLSMLVRESNPHESLQCAQAALRISAGWAPARLTTLLHLRAAHASALSGDSVSFARELAKAKSHFDRGPASDDPLYIKFVNDQGVAAIEGLSELALGRPDRAAAVFRRNVDKPDLAYRRNLGLHCLSLAESLRQQGDTSGAAEVAIAALPTLAELRSARVNQKAAQLRSTLGSQRPARAREFAEAYDHAMAA